MEENLDILPLCIPFSQDSVKNADKSYAFKASIGSSSTTQLHRQLCRHKQIFPKPVVLVSATEHYILEQSNIAVKIPPKKKKEKPNT